MPGCGSSGGWRRRPQTLTQRCGPAPTRPRWRTRSGDSGFAFGGELDWKLGAAPVAPEPRSVLAMAAATAEPVAPLGRWQGPDRTRSGWIDEYHSSSCLTFVEGIEPGELLHRFGVGGPDAPVRREVVIRV
jgi:hypothetical protein